jgi:predicted nucleic acid-binding protein
VSVFVVDASLVVKWFVPEIHAEAARHWLDGRHDFVAPDLLFPELGNVLWKKVQRGELNAHVARRLVGDVLGVAVETVPTRSLLEDALPVAISAGVTAYDAMYLTLAIRLDTQVVTGDGKFVSKVARHAVLAPYIRSLNDLPD